MIVGIVVVLVGAALLIQQNGSNAPAGSRSVSVSLDPVGNSRVQGTAAISEFEGKLKIKLALQNAAMGEEHPAHVHLGACPTPGDVKHPLVSVANGVSETTVSIDADAFLKNLPLAIMVHKSPADLKTILVCGNIGQF